MMAVQMLLLRKNSTFLGAHGGLLNALVNVVLGDDQQVGARECVGCDPGM
jgi:hypothetical protein